MSLFTWLTQKKLDSPGQFAQNSGLEHMDETHPLNTFDRRVSNDSGVPGNSKAERLKRRELLYAVVRDSMTSIGVLSAKYKFKVLSLDSHGNKYLIMMDHIREHEPEAKRLAEVEALIAQNAKSRHNLLVTAVYWRVTEEVMTEDSRAPEAKIAPTTALETKPSSPVQTSLKPTEHSVAVPPKEMEKLGNLTGSIPMAQKLTSPGEIVRSGRDESEVLPSFAETEFTQENYTSKSANKPREKVRATRTSPSSATGFADTEILDETNDTLSGTQFGELK